MTCEKCSIPVAQLPDSHLENTLAMLIQSSPQIAVSESTQKSLPVVHNKQAAAALVTEFHELLHHEILLFACGYLETLLHHVLNLV